MDDNDIQSQKEDERSEPIPDSSQQPKLKRPTKRRHRIPIDRESLKEAFGKNEPPVSPSNDTSNLESEPFDTNEEPQPIKPVVDVARYLEDNDDNHVSKHPHLGYTPNNTVSRLEDLHPSNQIETPPLLSDDFKENLDKPNTDTASDTTDGFPTNQQSVSPININQYVGHVVESKAEKKPLDDGIDHLETHETYEANKEIQRLLEKVSDDEEEPVKPLQPRQTIEVILIDETKKKKKKKSTKPKFETASDETMSREPTTNDFQLQQPTAAEMIKPVQRKKERVDTKEIAVQTIPVPEDIDSEDDSDQEILQYQQRSVIGGYLINTIPEEQEDESPLSTPDQNNSSSPVDEEQIYRQKGFLFRNTQDHEPTPRRTYQRTEKQAYSDPSFLPQKYLSEPTIKQDEEEPNEFSPHEYNYSPQIQEIRKKQSNEPKLWQEESNKVGPNEKQLYKPEDEKTGFDFDKSSEDIRSSPTNNIQEIIPIYKPRFEIQDFINEGQRRQTGVEIQAPPSKKHKMSSPHSPIDNALLESDLYQRQKTIPVSEEPQSVSPSYEPTYEIHNFIKQDVEAKFKPMSSISTNGFVLEENAEEEASYVDRELDLHGDITTPKDAEKDDMQEKNENVFLQKDGLKSTELEYQPRFNLGDSKNQHSEPPDSAELPTKHDTTEQIPPKYEPRFELLDLIAKEDKRDEKPNYREPVETTESPIVFFGQKEPGVLFNQPGYEVNGIILNEEPSRAENHEDYQESDTDDTLSHAYNQPANQPRYIMGEISNNKTNKIEVELEENKDTPFPLSGKDFIHETTGTERKEEENQQKNNKNDLPDGKLHLKNGPESTEPSYRSQLQPVPDHRANASTVPLVHQEPGIRPYQIRDVVLESQPQNIAVKPIAAKNRITTSSHFMEEEPKPLEEEREPEHISPVYQPQCEITNFVLEEQPEQPAESEHSLVVSTVNTEEPKSNRSFRRSKFTADDFILQQEPESEDEPIYPADEVDGSPTPSSILVMDSEIKNRNEASTQDDMPTPTHPTNDVKSFVIDESPLIKPAQSKPQGETKTDGAVTDPETGPKYDIPVLEIKDKVSGIIIEEEPENQRIRKKPVTDEAVQTSEDSLVEDESDFYRPFELKHEVKAFVMDEDPLIKADQPKGQDETTADVTPMALKEPDFTRSVNSRKYETTDLQGEHKEGEFAIIEAPETERAQKHPVTDETMQTSTETIIENESDFYRPFEPKHKVRAFVLDEDPLITRAQPKKQNEITADETHVASKEPDYIRSVRTPKYERSDLEIGDKVEGFVIEEEPEHERTIKHPATESTMQTSTETMVEDEPNFYRSFEPKHEVKAFVLEEDPLIRRQSKQEDESAADETPVTSKEPDFTRSVNSPKYDIPYLETSGKIKDFVIEEEPEHERTRKHPVTDETVQASAAAIVEDEPDFYRPFEPKHEVKPFVLDEDPLITRAQPKNQEEMMADKISVALKEPDHIRSVISPKNKIPDLEITDKVEGFVIEEEPEHERTRKHTVTDKTVNTSAEAIVEDEPDFYRPFEQKHEVGVFVLDEDPLISRAQPKKQDETTADETHVAPEDSDSTKSVNSPKYEISYLEKSWKVKDFVIEEEPEHERNRKHPVTDETVQTSVEAIAEDEPDFYRPFEQKHEVRAFVLDEDPLITRAEPKNQEETTADKISVALKEPDYIRSVISPKNEISYLEKSGKVKDFVIEEEPEHERTRKHPVTDETVQASVEAIAEDEPDFYRPFEQKHEVRAIVLDEEPLITRAQPRKQDDTTADFELSDKVEGFVIEKQEHERISKHQVTDKTVQATTETTVEDELDFYRPFEQRHEVKTFVLDEESLISRAQPKKQDEITADETPVASQEADSTRSVNSPKYEISYLERSGKVKDFVFKEQPEHERNRIHPVTDETVQTSAGAIVEDGPDFHRPFEQKREVRAFVLDEEPLITRAQPKNQEKTTPDKTPVPSKEPGFTRSVISPKHESPNLEISDKIEGFVIEEEPEHERIPKHPVPDERVETTAEDIVEDKPEFVAPKEPDYIRSVISPKYERADLGISDKVEDFVIEEGPKHGRIPKHPVTDERVQTSADDIVEDKPEFVAPKEPDYIRSVISPKHESQDLEISDKVERFVIEEEPEHELTPKHPITDERVETTAEDIVENKQEFVAPKEPDYIRSVISPQHEIPDLEIRDKVERFVIEEEPEHERIPKHPVTDERVETSVEDIVEDKPEFVAPKEPDYIRSVISPKFERPDLEISDKVERFVIEEEPEHERIPKHPVTDERAETSAEDIVEDKPEFEAPKEPDYIRSVISPKHESQDLEISDKVVIEEEPEHERTPKHPITDERVETSAEDIVEDKPEFVAPKEPDYIRSVISPKYERPDLGISDKVEDFVIEEGPEHERIPKHPVTDEKVQTSADDIVEDKPEFVAPKEPDYIRSVISPKHESQDLEISDKVERFVIEEPEHERTPKHPITDERAETSAENILQDKPEFVAPKEPDYIRSVISPKYERPDLEIRDKVERFVIEEEPEHERTPKHPITDERAETSAEDVVEDKPEFVAPKQPDYIRSVISPKFERPDLEISDKVERFVTEEEPEHERIPKHLVTDERAETSAEDIAEDKPEFVAPKEPDYIRSVISPKHESQDLEISDKVERFVIEEPKHERIPKHPVTDERVETSVEDIVEDKPEFVAPKEPDYIRSVISPKFERPDLEISDKVERFVTEEEPEHERIPKHPVTDERAETSAEDTVEEKLESYKPFEPKHKVKAVVADKDPLTKRAQPKNKDEATGDETPVVLEGSEYMISAHSPKYEIPDLKRSDKDRNFVIEDESEHQRTAKDLATDESVQTSTESIVEDEPDVYRPFKPRHEVKAFGLDREAKIKRDQLKDETKTDEVLIEPDHTKSVNSPKYEILDIEISDKAKGYVIKDEPEDERASKRPVTDKTVKTRTEAMSKDEPALSQQFRPKHEVKAMVFDEDPLISRAELKKQDETTGDGTPVASKEPDHTKSARSAKYKSFVIEEEPEHECAPKHPVTEETVQASKKTVVEDEPDLYRPDELKHVVKHLVLDEKPSINANQHERKDATGSARYQSPNTELDPHAHREPQHDYQQHADDVTGGLVDAPVASVYQQKPNTTQGHDKASNFVVIPKHDITDETINTASVSIDQEEPSDEETGRNYQGKERSSANELNLTTVKLVNEDPKEVYKDQDTTQYSVINKNITPTQRVTGQLEPENSKLSMTEEDTNKKGEQKRSMSGKPSFVEEPGVVTKDEIRGSFDAPDNERIISIDYPGHEKEPHKDEEVPQEANSLSVSVIEKREPNEMLVNTGETSQINGESYPKVETIPDDEPSRLDIDHLADDPSEKASPDFKTHLQTMLSHVYGTKEETIIITKDDSIDKTKNRPLEPVNKIGVRPLADIEQQTNTFSTENDLELENVKKPDGAAYESKTDTKLVSPITADDVKLKDNSDETVENVTSKITPVKTTLILEDEIRYFEVEHRKRMDSVDEKAIDTPISSITIERTNEAEETISNFEREENINKEITPSSYVTQVDHSTVSTTETAFVEQKIDQVSQEPSVRVDRGENADIEIIPSYVRQVDPPTVTTTERASVEQKVHQGSQEPSANVDREENIDTEIIPSYVRQVDPSTVTTTERDFEEQTIDQVSQEPSVRIDREENADIEIKPSYVRQVDSSTVTTTERAYVEQEVDKVSQEPSARDDREENIEIEIRPSYVRQVDPSVEIAFVEQESDQVSQESSVRVTIDTSENIPERIEKREESSIDIATINDHMGKQTEQEIVFKDQPEETQGQTVQLVEKQPDLIKTTDEACVYPKDVSQPRKAAEGKRGIIVLEREEKDETPDGTPTYKQGGITYIFRPVDEHDLPIVREKHNKLDEGLSENIDYETAGDIPVDNPQEQIEKRKIINTDIRITSEPDKGKTESPTLISVDVVDGEQEGAPIESDSMTFKNEMESQLIKQSLLREVNIKTTTVMTTEGMTQDIPPQGDGESAVDVSNLSELMAHEMQAKEVDDTKIIVDQRATEKESVIIYPPNRPQGITIQLIDEIKEPPQPTFRGTAVIEKLDEPGYLKKRSTIHATIRSEQSEIETEHTEFSESVPISTEQGLVRDADLATQFVDAQPQSEVEAGPLHANEEAIVDLEGEQSVPVDSEYLKMTNTQEAESVKSEESKTVNIGTETSSAHYENEMIASYYERQVNSVDLPTTEPIRVENRNEGQSVTTMNSVINNEEIEIHTITKRSQKETEHELITEPQHTGRTDVHYKRDLATTITERTTIEDEVQSQAIQGSKFYIRTTAVVGGELKQQSDGKGDRDIEQEMNNKSAIIHQRRDINELERRQTAIKDKRIYAKKEPVTIYPPNKPQGITIELIDDIPEPVEPEYKGTAAIQKIIDDQPAQLRPRTSHTTKYYESKITNTTTEFVENIPLANIEQQFVRDYEDDIPTTVVDGRSGIGEDSVWINAYDDSEHAGITETPISGDSESASDTYTREEFHEMDTANYEESEIISIASGTSSLDLQDDITINFAPSYQRQIDPSSLITNETVGGMQEMIQPNEIPSTTVETVQKREESTEIKTVTGRFEAGDSPQSSSTLKRSNSGHDQEHIYARVNKQRLSIRNENKKSIAPVEKSSEDSIVVDHQPGATTIAIVEKRSVRELEKRKFDEKVHMQQSSQIVDQNFKRVVDDRNFGKGEILQRTDTMEHDSYTETNQLDQGVVWMTVRHSKKLFGASASERIITLPIVNKLPSGDLSPTENLDFDLDNDGEMFSQRQKQDASDEYYTSTRVVGLAGEISVGSRGYTEESIMMKETEKDEENTFGTGTSVLGDKSKVTEGSSSIVTEQFKESANGQKEIVGLMQEGVEKKGVSELQQERYPDYSTTDRYENERIQSVNAKSSKQNEEVSKQSVRETLTEDDESTAESNVWCTVKLKRWESDVRRIHLSNQSIGKGASELSSSTASIDGSYEEDSYRTQSPNSEFSTKTESSGPWISVKRKKQYRSTCKCH